MSEKITVIGAGLAGCEAAHKLSSLGFSVRLCEMKPEKYSPAHKSENFAELVCSNSLKAMRLGSAAGLLKEEMRMLGSLTMEAAEKTAVAAGGALAVDREKFAEYITEKIKSDPNIEIVYGEVTEVPEDGIVVFTTGPLTSDALAENLKERFGGTLSFYDAVAPIVSADSLDWNKVFMAARYDRGEADYVNCPMERDEYDAFYEALVSAERAPLHEFETADPKVYEGCMPVEIMASRGHDTLRFGPLKPVGLIDPKTGKFKLSRRVLIEKPEGYVERERRPRPERPERPERPARGERPMRGERGERGDRRPRPNFGHQENNEGSENAE